MVEPLHQITSPRFRANLLAIIDLLISNNTVDGYNTTNSTQGQTDDDASVLVITDDKPFIISLSICIFIFLFVILISGFTGPRRLYFPCSDKSLFGISWFYGPTELWSPLMYFQTIRGSEYMLMYIWILKDFFWTQDGYLGAQICGISAFVLSVILAVRSAVIGHYREVFINITTSLWLMGNFWWMEGEVTDFKYPNNPNYPVYPEYSLQAHDILIAAACVLLTYYLVIRPFDLLKPSQEVSDLYNENRLESPFPMLFPLWRDYENFHMVVWLGKDLAWNGSACDIDVNWNVMWNIFVIPTILIGIHFVILTFSVKYTFIDHVHYIMLFLWVSGNILWAFAELYHPLGAYDDAVLLANTTSDSYQYLRWWCGWITVLDLCMIALLYLYWIPASYLGWVREPLWSGGESPLLNQAIKSDWDK